MSKSPLYYNIEHKPHDINPFIVPQAFFWITWVFIFQKRGVKSKHLKYTCLSNYLTKIKQKIKQFENAIIQK